MKVLYLNPAGGLGGAEKVLLAVMREVTRANPQIQLHLVSLAPGPLLERAAQLGVEVSVLPLPTSLASLGDSQIPGSTSQVQLLLSLLGKAVPGTFSAWRFLRRLQDTIRRIGPDLIHSNGIKTHCLVSFANSARVPVLWHIHDFVASRPIARRVLRMISSRATGAIAISRAVAEDLKTLAFRAPIEVIPNAVNVNEFMPGVQDGMLLDRLAGLPPADPACVRIGLVATYARWKGHDVFLQAAARLLQAGRRVPVRFFIIGGPIYLTHGSQYQKEELRQLAGKLGILDNLGFIDFQQEVVPIYQALDVVVQASTSPEPFGLTIIEAMACGKPVAASLGGGVVDIIRPGHDALGVPPGNVQALADAMSLLLNDPDLRLHLGGHARETVCRHFNQDRIGPQLLNVYRELCGGDQNERPQQGNLAQFSPILLQEKS